MNTPDDIAALARDLATQMNAAGGVYGQSIVEDDRGQPSGVIVLVTDADLARSLVSFLDIWSKDLEKSGRAAQQMVTRRPSDQVIPPAQPAGTPEIAPSGDTQPPSP